MESLATPGATEAKSTDTVPALVQLLKARSYGEVRQRMYDNPPGSPWWTACKIELDIRNSERTASSAMDTSRVLDKIRVSAEQLNASTGKFIEATEQMTTLLKGTKELGRRVEIATYVIIAVAVMQLFYVSFSVLHLK